MFKFLRIALLLLILATVAQEAWLARARAISWQYPLRVAIYPIAGDDSPASADYRDHLPPDAFTAIERFFDEEARRYALTLSRPVAVTIAPPVTSRPPQPPTSGSSLDNLIWSLQMRWWAWRHDDLPGSKPQVRLFVMFFDPAQNERLPHSVGVKQGMIGLINAFASPAMSGSNAVIIAHELLHTLGATDKYVPGSNLPRYPDGYAEPDLSPRFPQTFAEIMGGRIPVSEDQADIPRFLSQALIGPATATEIGWSQP